MPYTPPEVSPLFGQEEEPTAVSVVVGPVTLVIASIGAAVSARVALSLSIPSVDSYVYYYYQTQTQTE